MAKTELTRKIEKALIANLDTRKEFGCLEVTLGWYGKEIVDFIVYNCEREVKCYEIKVSKSDFNSNAKLSFFGNKNYYVMPAELYEQVKDEIKYPIGCYVYTEGGGLRCVLSSRKQELKADKEVILSSMLRSLTREFKKGDNSIMNQVWNDKGADYGNQ